MAGNVPEEFLRFFRSPGGHSMVIKGPPGSGKTTLVLEVGKALMKKYPVKYFTSRVGDESLLSQFPWAGEMLHRREEKSGKGRGKLSRSGLHALEGRIEGSAVEVDEESITLEYGSIFPELESIYDFVEANLDNKPLIIIDSLEGFSELYGVSESDLARIIQQDLVEEAKANVIYVMESDERHPVEYLGDAVVQLYTEYTRGGILRKIYIQKMRGYEIRKPIRIYTLWNGRFTVVEECEVDPLSMGMVLEDRGATHGWGARGLTEAFEPFEPGSINLFVVEDNAKSEYLISVMSGIMASAWKKGLGILFIPSQMAAKNNVFHAMRTSLGEEPEGVVVADFFGRPDIFLEGQSLVRELSPDIIEYHMQGRKEPYLFIAGVDTLKTLYREMLNLEAYSLFTHLKKKGAIVILLAPRKMVSALEGMYFDKEILFTNIEGIMVVKGEKPLTLNYALRPVVRKNRYTLKTLPLL